MIGGLKRAYAAFRGFDDGSASVPMMDGPLRPNESLDAAPVVLNLPDIDNLVPHDGVLHGSSGSKWLRLKGAAAAEVAAFEAPISCAAAGPSGSLVLGLDGIGLRIVAGPHAGTRVTELGGRPLSCATAALFVDENRLVVANGSRACRAADWKRDLMERGGSGEMWLLDLSAQPANATLLAQDLAFPCGLAQAAGDRLLVSEAWRHRVTSIAPGKPARPLLSELPAYPSRIVAARGGGYWLALFAPRNQLVEFVLREDGYRRKMIETVHPDFWIAPALSSGSSFLEPIQGGARKKLNRLKPWSPSWSYGLVARCGPDMRPLASYHSRADGAVHGVTSICESDGPLYVAAKGSGRLVAIAWGGGNDQSAS